MDTMQPFDWLYDLLRTVATYFMDAYSLRYSQIKSYCSQQIKLKDYDFTQYKIPEGLRQEAYYKHLNTLRCALTSALNDFDKQILYKVLRTPEQQVYKESLEHLITLVKQSFDDVMFVDRVAINISIVMLDQAYKQLYGHGG